MKSKILWVWRTYLIFSFFFFLYHLVRDILQDVLGIHNGFTEILHVELDPTKLPSHMTWLLFGGYRKWYSFPIEIFMLVVIPFIWKLKKLVVLDLVVFSLFILHPYPALSV